MALREMKVNGGWLEIDMAEQCLHSRQISAAFDQVSCETVPQQMGCNVFGDAGSLRRLFASRLKHFGGDRLICSRAIDSTREKVDLRLHPPPVFEQSLQEFRAQWNVPVATPFSLTNADEHALAVNILTFRLHTSALRMPVE